MKPILESLFEKNILTKQEAKNALLEITSGKCNNAHITAFITVYLMREISADELDGFREALLEVGKKINLSEYDPIDLCGTGGDNKNTFNISTIASFIVAGAGVKVAKHGNYAISSSCGSSNILEYFGYSFTNSEEIIRSQIENAGICFLHAPLYQTALKNVADIRKELNFKTFFNMLGPLINPAYPLKQVMGVYSLELATLYKNILSKTAKDYAIIYSLDGFDEISLTGPYRIITNNSDLIIDPESEGFKKVNMSSIKGGSNISESAKIFTNILQGDGTREQNDVVIANAAIAIKLNYPKISKADSIEMARESLTAGKALKTFKKLMGQ